MLSTETSERRKRLMPLLLYDLDGNGGNEIVLGGLNRVYWNDGQGNFRAEPLTAGRLERSTPPSSVISIATPMSTCCASAANEFRCCWPAIASGRFNVPAT